MTQSANKRPCNTKCAERLRRFEIIIKIGKINRRLQETKENNIDLKNAYLLNGMYIVMVFSGFGYFSLVLYIPLILSYVLIN